MSAQAEATCPFGRSVPGMVAQPPRSTNSRRCQDEVCLSCVSRAGASACARNWLTQNGTRPATTAASERCTAMRSAVPPSIQPPHEKPTIMTAMAPQTPPHTAGFVHGGIDIFIRLSLVPGKRLFC